MDAVTLRAEIIRIALIGVAPTTPAKLISPVPAVRVRLRVPAPLAFNVPPKVISPLFVVKIVVAAKRTLAAPRFISAPSTVLMSDPLKVNINGSVAVIPPLNVLLPRIAPIINCPVFKKEVLPAIVLFKPKIEI